MQLAQIKTCPPSSRPLTSTSGFQNLAIELVRTADGYYAFDAGTVEFVQVDEVAFELLDLLRQEPLSVQQLVERLPQFGEDEVRAAHAELLEAQSDGHLLPARFRRAVAYAKPDSQLEEKLTNEMAGLTVFLTTECNLACSYCIFGGQYQQHAALAGQQMPWPTLKNAMDFLHANSGKQQEIRVDFFGGEPMLAFEMAMRAVSYLKSLQAPDSGRRILPTFTTNGTIITDSMLDQLIEEGAYLQISIDAAKEDHDRERRFKANGRGTFDVVMRNLRRIRARDAEYFRTHLRLKAVITSASMETSSEEFFHDPLIEEIVDLGFFSFIVQEPHYDLERDRDHFDRMDHFAERLHQIQGVTSLEDLLDELSTKQRQVFAHFYTDFFDMQAVNKLYFEGKSEVPFRKGCLTGYAEGALMPDGNISVCHKATGGRFVIGNVNEGHWHFDRIRALYERLEGQGRECSSCFVQRFCSLCFEKLDGRALDASAHSYCEFTRQHYRKLFEQMLVVMEHNPELWGETERVIERKLDEQEKAPTCDASSPAPLVEQRP